MYCRSVILKSIAMLGLLCVCANFKHHHLHFCLVLLNKPGRKHLRRPSCFLYHYFFCPQDQKGQIHQVWYDDPQSICPKANAVMPKGLRGIGMWNGNILDYSDDPVAKQQTAVMWNALLGC